MNRTYQTALLVFVVSLRGLALSTFAQQPSATYWAGAQSDGSSFILELMNSGRLRFIPETGIISEGNWKQKAKTIEIQLNGNFVRLSGELNGERMEGTAVTKRGARWKWSASQQPYVISTAAPIYPPLASAAGIGETVSVDVDIDPSGIVASVHFAKVHPLLRAVSENAAAQYRFQPTAQVGARTARLTFIFVKLGVSEEREKIITPTILSPYQIEVRHRPPFVERSYIVGLR